MSRPPSKQLASRTVSTRRHLDCTLRDLWPKDLRTPPLDNIACTGFITTSVLARWESEAQYPTLRENRSLLIELGCGSALLGAYIGRKSSAIRTVGVDIDIPLLLHSRQQHSELFFDYYVGAAFTNLPFPENSCYCAVSLDALYLASASTSALSEIRRVLAPNAKLIFSAYTANGALPGGSQLKPDWLPVLKSSGYRGIESYDGTEEWRELMWEKHMSRLRSAHDLRNRFGAAVDPELAVSAAMVGLNEPSFLGLVKRWEFIAYA